MRRIQRAVTTPARSPAFLLAAVLACSLSACASGPVSGGIGLARMPVAEMRPPNVVVAENGAVCFVSAKKFATIKLGQNLWCRWKRPSFPVPSSPTP